jgi:hypothetical protein
MNVTDNPRRPLAVYAAAQSRYARLARISKAALTAAIGTSLPIVVRLFILPGGPKSARWKD